MQHLSRFGVGCFVFASTEPVDAVEAWRSAILGGLDGISSIEQIDCNVQGPGGGMLVREGGLVRRTKSGHGNVGREHFQPGEGILSFTVSIPSRVRTSVAPGGRAFRLQAQKFRVDTYYEYFGPATFVTPLR